MDIVDSYTNKYIYLIFNKVYINTHRSNRFNIKALQLSHKDIVYLMKHKDTHIL